MESLSSAEVYDVTTHKWSQLPQMKEQRKYCAATAVANRIYVVGGSNSFQIFRSSCKVFDISTNTWPSSIPDMKEMQRGYQAVSIGTKIYVMGGRNNLNVHSLLEVFDTSSSTNISTSSEQTGSTKWSHLEVARNVAERKANEKNNDDHISQQSSESYAVTRPNTSQSDIVYFSSLTARERVVRLEQMSGFKHESCALLKCIEYLEINIFGEYNGTGILISKRIKALEKEID